MQTEEQKWERSGNKATSGSLVEVAVLSVKKKKDALMIKVWKVPLSEALLEKVQ